MLDKDLVLSLLVEEAHLPPEWTTVIEDVQASDQGVERTTKKRMQERAMSFPQVRRAIAQFPNEPIVRYCWPDDRVTTIFESGEQAMRQSVWRGVDVIERQDEDEIVYEDETVTVTREDEEIALAELARRVSVEARDLAEAEEWPPEEERNWLERAISRITSMKPLS